MQLTLVHLDGVVAPGVLRELNDAVFSLAKGHFVHRVRAVGIAVQGIHRLLVVKADYATGLPLRHVEGRMTTNLEMNLAGVGVVHMPDDAYLITIEHIADAQREVIGVHLLRGFGRFEGQGNLPVAPGNELELGIAGKAVARQVILPAIHAIGLMIH